MERIDKILASQNLGSRKEVHKLIKTKTVFVNGRVCTQVDFKVEPNEDEIVVMGNRLEFKRNIYIMMNKPKGVLSASNDKKAHTVIDLLPENLKRRNLFPAGRLDKDTTGLLIITDDGEFAHNMLAPKKHVFKIYRAELSGSISDDTVKKFENGIIFADGTRCLPAKLWLNPDETDTVGYVKICEGKYHQVKKMFLCCGLEVVNLKRLSIGGLKLDENLQEGGSRELLLCEKQLIFTKDLTNN